MPLTDSMEIGTGSYSIMQVCLLHLLWCDILPVKQLWKLLPFHLRFDSHFEADKT